MSIPYRRYSVELDAGPIEHQPGRYSHARRRVNVVAPSPEQALRRARARHGGSRHRVVGRGL